MTINPHYLLSYARCADACEELKDNKAATEILTAAINQAPQSGFGWYERGNFKRYALDDHNGAIKDLTKALELDPNYSSAYAGRGVAKTKTGDHRGALSDLNKAIEIDPDASWALLQRGILKRSHLKDPRGAIEDYTAALRINPKDKYALANRYNAKKDIEDYQGASPISTLPSKSIPTTSGPFSSVGGFQRNPPQRFSVAQYRTTSVRSRSILNTRSPSTTSASPSKHSKTSKQPSATTTSLWP